MNHYTQSDGLAAVAVRTSSGKQLHTGRGFSAATQIYTANSARRGDVSRREAATQTPLLKRRWCACSRRGAVPFDTESRLDSNRVLSHGAVSAVLTIDRDRAAGSMGLWRRRARDSRTNVSRGLTAAPNGVGSPPPPPLPHHGSCAFLVRYASDNLAGFLSMCTFLDRTGSLIIERESSRRR